MSAASKDRICKKEVETVACLRDLWYSIPILGPSHNKTSIPLLNGSLSRILEGMIVISKNGSFLNWYQLWTLLY
jgi:hypothetical protein